MSRLSLSCYDSLGCTHRKGTGLACAATSGESALHLNTKIALGQALQVLAEEARLAGRLPELEIALACIGAPDCPLPARRLWLITWDHVEIECRLGVHRPDIVLKLDGRDVGALEILVSHEVTPEKATALRLLNVPWLEVLAAKLGIAGPHLEASWSRGTALPVHRASKESGQWYCPTHEASRWLSEARQEYQAIKERQGPAAQALVAYGKELAASEKEVARVLAEAENVKRAANEEIARVTALTEQLPNRIQESRRLLERAKLDLAAAEAAAAQRTGESIKRLGESASLEGELHELDEELQHYESLRRRLAGESDAKPGEFVSDGRRTLYWRPVDVYRAQRWPRHWHRAMRTVFHVDRVAILGKATELWLVEDGNTRHCRVDANQVDADLRLWDAFEQRLSAWRLDGAILDCPCNWVRVPYGESIPNEAWWEVTGPAPRAYVWNEADHCWMLNGLVDAPRPGI